MRRFLSFLAAMSVSAVASAQPVYESRDRAGPVFSDIPSQGSSEVTLTPLNRMDPIQAPAAATDPRASPAVAPYVALRIVEPENGGTIHSNTGEFSVQLAIDPALKTRQGDVIAVKLDGMTLPDTRSSLPVQISQADWQMAATDSTEHQLEVAVLDHSGKALIVSAPVRFYVHRATRN